MKYEQIQRKYKEIIENQKYKFVYYKDFNYNIFSYILYHGKVAKKDQTYNDIIIMLDTETSKSKKNPTILDKKKRKKYRPVDNYVVAWTISFRAFNTNIATLYGTKPSELMECINMFTQKLKGFETYIYVHHLAYDWVFLRKFFIKNFGEPEKQLNTKPHYPITLWFTNGIILKDSLILAQRKLEKWANDLNVEHKKAVGKWDYNLIRHQNTHQNGKFTKDELEYIECDTLAGVECIDKTLEMLNKNISTIPYTATGIVRDDIRKIAKKNKFKDTFNRMCLTATQQLKAEKVFHGGYTHGNRKYIGYLFKGKIKPLDFASSYPYVMLSEKYPFEKFTRCENAKIEDILNKSNEYAFMFKLVLVRPKLKKDKDMSVLQFNKCDKTINAILDNGRILYADYVELYTNEIDLSVFVKYYDFDKKLSFVSDVEFAKKEYLPRWLTDYIFELFKNKTSLKHADYINYMISKGKINSVYGCHVQKPVRENYVEDFEKNEYIKEDLDFEKEYEKYINRRNSILPYQWGVWVTSYAFRNLFLLGECVADNGIWIYSDTDSAYSTEWNMEKVKKYNENCIKKLKTNGYGGVEYDGRVYYLGVAEEEDYYTEFKTLGAKRYCGRSSEDNELHITIAGVPPKKGSKCLKNDINNFDDGFIFDGEETKKLTHFYNYVDDIFVDKNGNEVADSIDLVPCDYLLQSIEVIEYDFEELFNGDIEVQVYE